MIEGVLQHRLVPVAERRQVARRGPRGGDLDRIVRPAHDLGGLRRDAAIFLRTVGPRVPGSVHLIAQAPELDAMRLIPAMRPAEFRQCGAARVIAVLDEVAGILRSPRGEVDNEHGLDAGEAAPVDELVGAESVGFDRLPSVIEAPRPLPDRTDAVFPSIGGDEVSAGILDDCGTKLLDEIEHVAAKPPLVGGGVARLVNAAINAAPEMLNEGAKQARVDAADGKVSVEQDFGLPHAAYLPGEGCDAAAFGAMGERRAGPLGQIPGRRRMSVRHPRGGAI